MNRVVLAGLLATCVTIPAVAAEAAAPKKPKPRTRTLSFDYRAGPVFYATGVANGVLCSVNGVDVASCFEIPLKPDELYVKMTATDTSGQAPGIHWHEGSLPAPDSSNGYDGVKVSCGSGSGKLRKPKQIVVYVGPVVPSCPVATTGKLTVVVSNVPIAP